MIFTYGTFTYADIDDESVASDETTVAAPDDDAISPGDEAALPDEPTVTAPDDDAVSPGDEVALPDEPAQNPDEPEEIVPALEELPGLMAADIGTQVIEDGTIRIEVDGAMQMTVYRIDGGALVPMTEPIENLDASGATAVSGGWANSLPWSSAVGTTFGSGNAKILSPKSGYVTTWTGTGSRLSAGYDTNETLLTDDFTAINSELEKGVKTYFGTGDRLTVTGINDAYDLTRKLVIETSNAVPGVAAVSTYYEYSGDGSLNVTKFVENNFKIEDVPATQVNNNNVNSGLWTFQGSATSWGRDYVMPVFDTMGTGNPTSAAQGFNATQSTYNTPNTAATIRNNWLWTVDGCIAYNNYYGTNVGIGLGSFMPYHVYGLEIPTRGSGIANNHNIAYTWVGWPGKTLDEGVEEYIGTSMITVYDGDFYDANSLYSKAMSEVDTGDLSDVKNLVTLPSSAEMPDWAWAPIYETWGYGENFNPKNTMDIIPELKELGIKSITLDAGWYQRTVANGEGTYYPQASKWLPVATALNEYYNINLPCTNEQEAIIVINKFVQYCHEHGINVVAWCQPSMTINNSVFQTNHPTWVARDASGATINCDGKRYLCLGNPEVLNDFTDYFCDLFFNQYGFDGLKVDSLYGSPLCMASGHGHDGDPEACVRGYGEFYKLIYDKANLMRGATATLGGPVTNPQRSVVIMNCNCGSPHDYFGWSGQNRPVPGDSVGARQQRYLVKSFLGFYGTSFPVAGDHLYLSKLYTTDEDERPGPPDYISRLGTGSVFDTKYVTGRYNAYSSAGEFHSNQVMLYPGQTGYTTITGSGAPGTTSRTYRWGDFIKYFGLYNDLQISRGEFQNLYKYGLDYPEGYVFKQDSGDAYYSFYATTNAVAASGGFKSGIVVDPWGSAYYSANKYSGPVEIRGLKANTAYFITDVIAGKQWSAASNSAGNITLSDMSFATGIVLKVSTAETTSIFGKVYNGASIVPGAMVTLLNQDGTPVAGISKTAADLNGDYCFPIVPDGVYKVKATAYTGDDGKPYPNVTETPLDFTWQPFQVTGGEYSLDLDFTKTGSIYHVAVNGNNASAGTESSPWATITYALTQMKGGDTLLVHEGTYIGRYTIGSNLSGPSKNQMTVIQSAGDGEVILDGDGTGTVITMSNLGNIRIEGFTVTNATSNGIYYSNAKDAATLAMAAEAYDRDLPPSETNVSPFDNIVIKNNKVYNINTTSHAIGLYANNYMAPVTNLVISGNKVWGNRTYWSEAVVVNGNFDGFDICHNFIYNNNNIGIDMIGFEGSARVPVLNAQGSNANVFPDPAGTPLGNLGRDRFDMARNGRCYDNVIFGSCTIDNEAYWEADGGYLGTRVGPPEGEFDRCCDGIYTDGGKNLEIFNNFIFDSDIGIEVSTEHGPPELYWVEGMNVHDNIIASCMGWNGLSIGGQSVSEDFDLGGVMGKAKNSKFENNILYGNIVNINIQNTENNSIKNNIIMGGGAATMDWLDESLHSANNIGANVWYNDPSFGVSDEDFYREVDKISQILDQIKVYTAPLANPRAGDFTVTYGDGNSGFGTDPYNWGGIDGWSGEAWAFDTSCFNIYADFNVAYDEMKAAVKFLEKKGQFDYEELLDLGYDNLRAYLTDALHEAGFSNSSVPYILKVWAPRSGRIDGWISNSARTNATFATDPYKVVNMMNPDAGNNLMPGNERAINNGNIDSAAFMDNFAASGGHLEYKYYVMVATTFDDGVYYTQGDTRGGVVIAAGGTAVPSASVEKLTGNKNNLTIVVNEYYTNGHLKNVLKKTFSIDNNAAATYNVGEYKVYVDTKGNTQVRECYIVE